MNHMLWLQVQLHTASSYTASSWVGQGNHQIKQVYVAAEDVKISMIRSFQPCRLREAELEMLKLGQFFLKVSEC